MKFYSEIVLILFILAIAIIGVVDARSLAFLEKDMPGPGFFPIILGTATIGFSLLAGRALLAKQDAAAKIVDRDDLKRLLRVLLLLAVTVVVIAPLLGIMPAIALFYLVSLTVWTGMGISRAIMHTAGLTATIYLIFSVWLNIQLPWGSF